MCVSWRLGREVVAGENRLAKFRKRDSRKPRMGLRERTRLLSENSPRGPSSVNG